MRYWVLNLFLACSIAFADRAINPTTPFTDVPSPLHGLPLPQKDQKQHYIVDNGFLAQIPQVVGIVTYPNRSICSASIFYGCFLLTAAHCAKVKLENVDSVTVYGDETTHPPAQPADQVGPENVYLHDSEDLALIKLNTSFPPERSFTLNDVGEGLNVNETATIAGYGYNQLATEVRDGNLEVKSASGEGIQRTGQVQVVGLASDTAKSPTLVYAVNAVKPTPGVPADELPKPQHALFGDSGGPLVKNRKIYGVCKDLRLSDRENNYTAIAPYKKWMQDGMKALGSCGPSPQQDFKAWGTFATNLSMLKFFVDTDAARKKHTYIDDKTKVDRWEGQKGKDGWALFRDRWPLWAKERKEQFQELKTAIKQFCRIPPMADIDIKPFYGLPETSSVRDRNNRAEEYFHFDIFNQKTGKAIGTFSCYYDNTNDMALHILFYDARIKKNEDRILRKPVD